MDPVARSFASLQAWLPAALLAASFTALPAAAQDTDGDGVPDSIDNCTNLSNLSQYDVDMDGFGNRCDADFDNDCDVDAVDQALFVDNYFTTEALYDLTEPPDGIVGAPDFAIFASLFNLPPGPGTITCVSLLPVSAVGFAIGDQVGKQETAVAVLGTISNTSTGSTLFVGPPPMLGVIAASANAVFAPLLGVPAYPVPPLTTDTGVGFGVITYGDNDFPPNQVGNATLTVPYVWGGPLAGPPKTWTTTVKVTNYPTFDGEELNAIFASARATYYLATVAPAGTLVGILSGIITLELALIAALDPDIEIAAVVESSLNPLDPGFGTFTPSFDSGTVHTIGTSAPVVIPFGELVLSESYLEDVEARGASRQTIRDEIRFTVDVTIAEASNPSNTRVLPIQAGMSVTNVPGETEIPLPPLAIPLTALALLSIGIWQSRRRIAR